jgi:hypothetical protein
MIQILRNGKVMDGMIKYIPPTHNIANGGDCSKFRHCSPLQTFSSVDSDALRKPPLAILPNVTANSQAESVIYIN